MKCPYRADKECPRNRGCNNCLLGQIADNTDLLITAIANLTASFEESKMEAILKLIDYSTHEIECKDNTCREEQK